ncbi:MAG: DUF4340 domain-containing protein [Myxococcota bacterium]
MSKNAWISVSVFLTLLVLVFATREDRVAVGIRTLELPKLAASDVEQIEITGKHKAVLAKDGAAWSVSDPEKADRKYPADSALVTSALDAVAELEAGAFVTGRKEKHSELEVDDEKGLAVELKGKGVSGLKLVFGRSAKDGGNYVRKQGSDEVFIAKGRLGSLLAKDVSAWRKKKLLDVEASDITALTLEPSGQAPYRVEAREAGEGDTKATTWAFAADVALPPGFLSDEEQLRRLSTSAAGLRAADFFDDDKSAEELGLGATPSLGRIIVAAKDGKATTLRFGTEDDKKRIYTQLEGDPQVYLLPSYQATNLLKPLSGLRDLSLVRFDKSAVTRVLLEGSEGRAELVREGETFRLSEPAELPPGFELDLGRVDGLLANLERLKAQERFDAAPGAAGLESATTKITLQLGDGTTKVVAFGSEYSAADGGKRVYARGAEESNVYGIGTFQKTRFDKPLELLKKLEAPPMPPGGGGMQGLDSLPPDIRKKLEESLRQQGR